MQGIGVALAPTGLTYLVEQMLAAKVVAALEQHFSAPDSQLAVKSWTDTQFAGSTLYENYELYLTNGTFTTFAPALASYAQQQAEFTFTMGAPDTVVDYSWRETYKATTTLNGSGQQPPVYEDRTYDYPHTFPEFEISVTFTLTYTGGAYQLACVRSSADPGTDSANIPAESALQTQVSDGCFSGQVSQATESQIKAIDFGAKVQSALSTVFASIADSGQLGDVTFEFKPGSGGLAFPAGGGLQIGVTGDVVAAGIAWSSTVKVPADVALPDIPSRDIAYNIQDFEFDAQLWGFFKAGVLKITLLPGDITNAAALRTSSYRGTSLNVLATKYPNASMTAALDAQAAPTVTFQVIYELTTAIIEQIQGVLTQQHVWTAEMGTALAELVNSVYVTQAGFSSALSSASAALAPYVSTIEQYAGAGGVVAVTDLRCVLSVLEQTTPIPVITFDVTQQFVMQNVKLGVAGASTQSLTFDFAESADGALTTTFVSSTLPGVDKVQWGNVWMALSSSWADLLNGIGTHGVPLPRILGFDLLAPNAALTIHPPQGSADGYVSVVADVQHAG